MKIGIITWFRYENYGTKLQAIALQSYLREKGHDVELIDFQIPEPINSAKKQSVSSRLYRKINYLALKCSRRMYKEQLKIRSCRLEQVIQEKCIIKKKAENDISFIGICNEFNLIICGSDQIWNPNWYHPYYYADLPGIKTKKVSYAPSIGIQSIPENTKLLIQKSLKSFSYVTVREETAASLLEPLLGYRPQKVLDPTMLMSGRQWKEMFQLTTQIQQRYILCYFLSDNRNHWNAVVKFAHKHNLSIKIIPQQGFSFFQKGEIHADAGVKEFLELIQNAEYVLTDSFHGTVFSILFEKGVYVFERFQDDLYSSQNARVMELVKQFGIEDHLIPYNSKNIEPKNPIDYSKVHATLNTLRSQSEKILQTEIKE